MILRPEAQGNIQINGNQFNFSTNKCGHKGLSSLCTPKKYPK